MTDRSKDVMRYVPASLRSPKLKIAPIKTLKATDKLSPELQIWLDEAVHLPVDERDTLATFGTTATLHTWTPEGMKVTPISAEEFYAAQDDDTALTGTPDKA